MWERGWWTHFARGQRHGNHNAKPTDKQPDELTSSGPRRACQARKEVRVLSERPFSLDPKDPDAFALTTIGRHGNISMNAEVETLAIC